MCESLSSFGNGGRTSSIRCFSRPVGDVVRPWRSDIMPLSSIAWSDPYSLKELVQVGEFESSYSPSESSIIAFVERCAQCLSNPSCKHRACC